MALLAGTAHGQLFVAGIASGTVGEHTTSGTTVNALLISELSSPLCLTVTGNDLFLANSGNGTIGEYTTSGATVNAELISVPGVPDSIAIEQTPEPASWALDGPGLASLFCYLSTNSKKLKSKATC